MKKLVFALAAVSMFTACKKWENWSTEKKVTGVWNGNNQEIIISAAPLFDSSAVEATDYLTANFMEDGGLLIDSMGTQLDSIGWSIKNDTVLVLSDVDMGSSAGGMNFGTSNMEYVIKKLTQEEFIFVYDTTLSVSIPNIPLPIDVTIKQKQRWMK